MSAESLLLTIDTTTLQETVGRINAGHDRLEEFLRGFFGDLDTLADKMVQQAGWLDSTKQSQETQWSEREQRIERERQDLEATLVRLQELTDQLGSSAAVSSGGSEQLQEVFAGFQEERSSLQAAVTASESQGAELARMADELAAARQELSETREELRSQREMLSQVPAQSDHTADGEIHDRLDQLEQERLAWVHERAVLETELDTVRTRAAELADTLDENRQRATNERKDWADELRQMRQLLQALGDRPAAPVESVAEPPPVAPEPVEDAGAQDPVLDSVMAQFEILQKDLARRRKAKPASK